MEAKELLDYFGLEADTLDDFKKKFHEKFPTDEKAIKEKYVKPALGETLGKIQNKILNKYREDGVEFVLSEFEGKDLEEVALTLSERKATKLKTELEDLRKKSGANGDEVVKEWQEKFEKATKRATEEEKLRKELAGEFDTFKQTAAQQVKQVKVNYLKGDLMGKLKLKPGVKDLEREGFNAFVDKTYRFDFDDKDRPMVLDAEGNRIRSEKKADEWKTPDEVLTEAAKKFDLLAENPKAGNPAPRTFTPQNAPPAIGMAPAPANQKRKVNPMFDHLL